MASTKNTRKVKASLLPGEKLDFVEDLDSTRKLSDEEIERKYVKGEIRIVTETARYPLDAILDMLKSTDYDVAPEYQRRHRWDDGKKSRLIESFIMNVPVPPIFLYETDFARYEVMDGRQRMAAISEFYQNKLHLQKLEYWKELEGRSYKDLPPQVRRGIDRRHLSSIILMKETAKSEQQARQLKQIVFERLNSGGVKLEPQETRNALYRGPLNDLCMKLSENTSFREMWHIPRLINENGSGGESISRGRKMYERMDDVELVLRFFAYRQMREWKSASLNRLNHHLDDYLREGNKKFNDALLDGLSALFNQTVALVHGIFKTKAFCRYEADQDKWSRPSKFIYDPVMYTFSQYIEPANVEALIRRRKDVMAAMRQVYKEHPEVFGGRKTNRNDMLERERLVSSAIARLIR